MVKAEVAAAMKTSPAESQTGSGNYLEAQNKMLLQERQRPTKSRKAPRSLLPIVPKEI